MPRELPRPASLTPRIEVVVDALPRLLLVFVMGTAAIPLAVWLVFSGRGSIEHFAYVFVPAVLLALVLAIAALALWLFAFRIDDAGTRHRLQWASALALGLSAVAVVVAPSYFLGRVLNYSDIRAARGYCMMLVPRLAAYKERQGMYPENVRDVLPPDRPMPRLLNNGESFYRTVGAEFEFHFRDPSGWDSGNFYFSRDVPSLGHWQTW